MAETQPKETKPDPTPPYPQRQGIIDTLDSIVVAFILAFVFRAFVVEAFVIPTGSMAPTLYGAHGTIICEDCGTEFSYGLLDSRRAARNSDVTFKSHAVCPNCAHANTDLRQNDLARNKHAGDRILVLKWPYDFGIDALGPQRWDVTVFKNPSDGYQNYIKRLAGLPNEVLMIVDGDIYTAPTQDLSAETLAAIDELRHEKYELRTGQRYGTLSQVPSSVLEELDEKLRIARKTRVAQKALWFTVYDHDYPPRELDDLQPRWEAGRGAESPWNPGPRRARFAGQDGAADYLELAQKSVSARCAYNVSPFGRLSRRPPFVSDQRVSFVLAPESPSGRLHLRLEKRDRVFWATLDFSGLVTLSESEDVPDESAPVLTSKKLAPFVPGKAVEVVFENVDYRVTLSVGGAEVLATSNDSESSAYYGPNLRQLRRQRIPPSVPPRLYGVNGNFELTHLLVERDVYYYQVNGSPTGGPNGLASPAWGTCNNPILLREDEFFMLGDNSAASQDSRLWSKLGPHLVDRQEACQLGTVLRDQLIGKAFFVYWPSGHRLDWLPRPFCDIGFVPNVGRMRWIR